MIAKFTNVKGEINYGIVVAQDPGGMVEVEWDTFTELLSRLEQEKKATDFVRKSLSRRKTWVRPDRDRPEKCRFELLPIITRIEWTDAGLTQMQRDMIQASRGT